MMPLHVAVTDAPGFTGLGLSLRVAFVTVKELLVANFASVLFANKRSSYVPELTPPMLKGTLPLAAPFVPRHPNTELSEVPVAKSPIQSLAVGFAIPLQLAVTDPPGFTVLGLSLRLAAATVVRTAPAADWPSGLKIVTVCDPTVAPTVEMFSVKCVGSV